MTAPPPPVDRPGGVFEKSRRKQRRSVRVWFGCRACGMHGDLTIAGKDGEAADALLRIVTDRHVCIERQARPAAARGVSE